MNRVRELRCPECGALLLIYRQRPRKGRRGRRGGRNSGGGPAEK
jgi:hypothetical protein